MARMDVRYREIALQAPGAVVDRALDRKREVLLHVDYSEQLQYLDDAEAGVLLKGIFDYHEENRGKRLGEYEPPTCIKEASKNSRLIGMVWAIWSNRMMDDMMRYVSTSIVRAEAGKAGGKKSAELRQAKTTEERARIKEELAEMEREAWNKIGEEAEKSADREREEFAQAWDAGINPITGRLRDGYSFPSEVQEEPEDDDAPDYPEYPEAFI